MGSLAIYREVHFICGIAGQIEYQRGLWEQAEIWSGIQAALRRRERACTLVYNGELYNADELRRELSTAGGRR